MVTWASKMGVGAIWLAFGMAPKMWGQTYTQGHGLTVAVPVPAMEEGGDSWVRCEHCDSMPAETP